MAPRAFKDGEAVQMKVQTLVSTETPLQVTFFGIAVQLFGGDMSAHEDATGCVSTYRMRQDSETAPIEAFSSEMKHFHVSFLVPNCVAAANGVVKKLIGRQAGKNTYMKTHM